MRVDYLVVGSGLTGAVIARMLSDKGRDVLVLDRRSHVGGNVHDHAHPSGLRIHTYGPHYFRTNSLPLWSFVNRFAEFYRYEACLQTLVDGRLERWPLTKEYIRRAVGEYWSVAFKGVPRNFEEASLAMMPEWIYEKFVKNYTRKQWGVPPQRLSAGLAKRFDIRNEDDPRLMRHKFQGLPRNGYAAFMENLLKGIPVVLNCDYLKDGGAWTYRRGLIFTGPIDEFFGFELGRLHYRGQLREHSYFADADFLQPCGQVNNPDPLAGPHIRTLEWKHMMPVTWRRDARGTVLTRETPYSPPNPNDYEYPFPDEVNAQLYRRYRRRAALIPKLFICGRLGEYRYYDMDQAIGRAMALAKKILKSSRPSPVWPMLRAMQQRGALDEFARTS
jgi:UDP-galactopyranose mutase